MGPFLLFLIAICQQTIDWELHCFPSSYQGPVLSFNIFVVYHSHRCLECLRRAFSMFLTLVYISGVSANLEVLMQPPAKDTLASISAFCIKVKWYRSWRLIITDLGKMLKSKRRVLTLLCQHLLINITFLALMKNPFFKMCNQNPLKKFLMFNNLWLDFDR